MAFFDELGAKLTKTGQKTMQMANDMADTAKLSLRISELNKSVQELYAKLGEQYYAACGEQPGEEFAQLCGQITENIGKIAQTRLEIQRIKQIKICPSCGRENPSSASFCSACSAALPELPPKEEPKPAGRTCPQCGAQVAESASFCTQCGSRLQAEPQPESAETPAEEPKQE